MKHYNHKRKFSSINFIVIFGLFLQTFTPLIAALQQIPVSHETFYVQDGAISDLSESVDLAEFNVEQLIIHVVEDAVQQDSYASLSQDLLKCYKTIIEGQSKVKAATLIKAMPELLQYAMLHENMRAPRPSTSNGNNAIASCNGGCDLTHVIQLLASIREHIGSVNDGACCNSILGILGDACNVPCIGENGSISEVLCEILDCCTQITGTINANVDLSGVYTSLADIKDTLTECCAETKADFEATWTILADLDLNCSTTVIIDLNGVFTVLADLNISGTVNVDLSGIYTAIADLQGTLTECCAEIHNDFQGTWTILADIENKIELFPTFTFIVTGTFIISVTVDLSGVYTAIADLKDTLTECCDEIKADIFDTQTLIISGFQGTWTILDDCCACGPIPLFQSDVDGDGEIKLTETGKNYCLAEDIFGNIVITGGNVTVDGNDRVLIGRVVIDGEDAIFKKAKIKVPPPGDIAEVNFAGIEVTPNGAKVQILSCLIECAPTVVDASPAINGRDGIHITGANVALIQDSNIFAGKGGPNTILGNSGNGGNGVILINSLVPTIRNSYIFAGDGQDSEIDGSGLGGIGLLCEGTGGLFVVNLTINGGNGGNVNSSSGNAGKGGDAILLVTSLQSVIQLTAANGGLGGAVLNASAGTGGDGGTGILTDTISDGITLQNVIMTGNQGGDSLGSLGGVGGDGMYLLAKKVVVLESIGIAGNAGFSTFSGVGSPGGHAIHVSNQNIIIESSRATPGNGGGNSDGPGGNGGVGIHIDQASDVVSWQNFVLEGGHGGNANSLFTPGTAGIGILVSSQSNKVQIIECKINDIGTVDTVGSGMLIENDVECIQVISNHITCCSGAGIDNQAGSAAVFYNNIVTDCNPNYINVDLVRKPGPQTGFYTNVDDGPQDCDLCDLFTVITNDFQQTWTILAGFNFDCSTTVVIDLNGVFTAIADVKDALIECCDEIKSDIFDTQTLIIDDFRQTWTILAGLNVNVDLTGVYTVIADVKATLTECCAEIKSDIFDTDTLMIDLFEQTWTILAGQMFNITVTIQTDLNGIFTSIADVKDTLTECCAEIKSDIFDTQTLIIDGFMQTWTILAGLDLVCSTTVIIDLNGVFTVLANLDVSCTAEVDLNGVFTAIADVKDTLTECCEEIKSDIFDTQTLIIADFAQTWTILAGLDLNCSTTVLIDLDGVFTAIADVKDTLTECCLEIKSDIFDTQTLIIDDFEQTWTILAELEAKIDTFITFTFIFTGTVEVTVDLTGVYTSIDDLKTTLTECCAEIKADFEQTWTILAALNVSVDLSGVYTSIDDLKTTLTTCCDEIQNDFHETWTILADIESKIDAFPTFTFIFTGTVDVVVDLGGVYTVLADIKDTLTECCEEIKSDIFDTQTLIIDDFRQTWTILAGLDLNCSTTVIIDLNDVFTAIADVKDTLTECCDEIKSDIFDTQTLIISDFAQTWTILAGLNVNVDLSGVYTAIADVKNTLTECCTEIKSDIFDTQTLIISDFAQTWTILAGLNVNVDLSGIYTAIADVKDTLTECCSEIKSDIFDTQTLIITDFAGTWTILADLKDTLTSNAGECCCDPIVIKPSDITNTTYVISTSGYYVFLDDINFAPASGIPAIRIISNNVRLDLCGKSLVQSNAQTGVDGIVVSGGTSGSPRENVIIQNGSVKSFTRVGVVVGTNSTTPANTACSRITISDIDTVSCGVGGIEILGTSGAEVREMAVQNCRVISCCTDTAVSPRTGLNAQFVIDGRFDGIDINQNGAGGLAVLYGFNLQSCQKCFVNQITMLTNSAATMEGLRVDTVIDSYINAINVVSNSAGLFTGVRFVGTTSGNTVSSSSVTDNIATASALLGYSFEISTTLNTIRNNTAMNNLASSTISSIANCIGFNFDQVSSYNVASNTSSFNRAPGASGTTNYAAGFFIGTTGVGTTGVKNSTFIDNYAIVNNGFTGTRSYGFRVESLAGGNVGNAYMNNNAVRNGGAAAINDYQILADSGAAPANPGGVPLTSIRDRTIANLNANVDKFTNLRVVN